MLPSHKANLVLALAPRPPSPVGSLHQEKARWSPPAQVGRAPGTGARGAQERAARGHKMALWFRGLGGPPDTIYYDRGPGPTGSGQPREGDPQVAESGCGGDSPLPPAPGRIG